MSNDIFSSISTSSTTSKLVFIDSQVENYQSLVAGVVPETEVIILSAKRDGIAQISEVVRHREVSEIHIVSHGSPGCLYLGNSQLSLDTLDKYQADLKTWFNTPLTDGGRGDLLLYGCNVAAGDAGEEFIEKLHDITGAEIAASATHTGSAALGGDWKLEVTTAEIKTALAFTPETIASYAYVLPGGTPIGITSLNTEYVDLPIDTSGDYSALGKFNTTTYQHKYQVGGPNNLLLKGFTAGTANYSIAQTVDQVKIQRVNNANVSGTRQILWFERESINTNTINLKPNAVTSMEEGLSSNLINRGADNVFANSGGNNINNVERIDFIASKGLSASSAALDDVGFLILERGGNDQFKIAAITAIDANGNPTAFTNPVSITNTATWGKSSNSLLTEVMVKDDATDANLRFSTSVAAQPISGIFFSYKDLGITGDQTFYGYTVVAGDAPNTASGIANVNSYPTTTAESAGTGGLDMVASGGVFVRNGSNVPPTLDLDANNSSGATGANYQNKFSFNGSAIAIADADTLITDLDNTSISSATITLTNRPNGTNETLAVLGTLPSGIIASAYDTATGVITLAGTATLANYQTAIAQITYNNTATTERLSGNRSITVTVNDGNNNSNTATTTINVTAVNDPPVIDLNTSTAGLDYSANFTENLGAVNVANSTTADAADFEDNITRLNIAITGSNADVASESVIIGGQSFALNANQTVTASVGGTTLSLAYTAASRTFAITNNAGSTTPIPQANLDTLLRGITYNNSSENPTTGNRTFTFTATDAGGGTSNPAVSTIAVAAVNDPPVLDLDANNSSTAIGANYQTTFTEGEAVVSIGDVDTTITDVDDTNIESATITLINAQASDLLAAGSLPTGITPSAYDPVTGVITLTGSASLADYQDAIRAITFSNTSSNPDTSDRSITVTVNDGASNSNTATSTIQVSNRIDGTSGSENLTGQSTPGTDLITGYEGQDTLTGSAGSDRFFYTQTSDGIDIITDFDATDGDKLVFSDIINGELDGITFSANAFDDGYIEAVTFGTGVMIQVDVNLTDSLENKNVVLLKNVDGISVSDIDASDFIF